MTRFITWASLLLAPVAVFSPGSRGADPADAIPRCHDARLVVERFAADPDIVHPVALDFDSRGRLLVVESHTHFRPANYKGPRHDRVRVLEDADADGKADRFTTFFEGTTATMDVAAHFDGSIYLATRNEILRLRDTDADGVADKNERVVFLDTKGNYPHNGLSGMAFDFRGDLTFGLGENLGASYKLVGTDGTTLTGEGEGGSIFRCSADGKGLRRVATGFWNPFGVCFDVFGRPFAVDNDPDSMPPCRLLHVVEGGDYGYQFRYGRSGRHPFQAWNGQIFGTLPMASGTGEAPCEVLSYESDGLTDDLIGDLLVTSWADHRVERYALKERGASVAAERKPFVQGGKDFRPNGMAVAPDGSLFVGDWVLADYNLHGRGAVWHIRSKDAHKLDRPEKLEQAFSSKHRSLRETAARQLAKSDAGRDFLKKQLAHEDVRARALALTALTESGAEKLDLVTLGAKEPRPELQALAVRAMSARGDDLTKLLDEKQPAAVRLEAVAGVSDRDHLLQLLSGPEPFLRAAAVERLSRTPGLLDGVDVAALRDPLQLAGVLLAHRGSGRSRGLELLSHFLTDADEEVRFLAVKWVADQKLERFRPQIADMLKDGTLSARMYQACATALARIDGRDPGETPMVEFFLARLADDKAPPANRVLALQSIPANHAKLTLPVLTGLFRQDDPMLRLEATRALREHSNPKRFEDLRGLLADDRQPEPVRAEAVVGLAERSAELLPDLLTLIRGDRSVPRDEALRALVNTKLDDAQRSAVKELTRGDSADLAARVLGQPFAKDRPKPEDLDGWLKRLDGPSDPDAGRRIFSHPRLAACSRCHRIDGRGADVGPDLSAVGRTDRRHILEAILQPGTLVAPHYQAWVITTTAGKTMTGMLIRTNLDESTYLDAQGKTFMVKANDVAETEPSKASIMPTGLADLLTDQELRDLLAYLTSRR